jgi:hypothetical protein
MLNIVSIIIGVVALLLAIPAMIPLLGIINWLVIPVAVLGAGIGMLSSGTAGRNLNLVVLVISVIRLSLGGGLF